ncbi:MAG: cytochrome c oxidase assembly protein [Candidatus Rokuibacteriota bacterium]|nr:MAG: cytochrome c oxidase assembly protein [Candidatus Rokubacteria bacterium]
MSWTIEPAAVLAAVGAATLYAGGWATLARRMPERFGPGRPVAFLAGLAALLLALSSPLDALGHQFLRAHMIQHLLLIVVAPPLLWMGAPMAPMLLGLPKPVRRIVAVGLASGPVRRLTRFLADPGFDLAAFFVAFWAWHVPALYDLALRSHPWHHFEHACFLITALLFWRPVILPWPARSSWPRWAMIPYLVLADVQNGVLAAIFTFSDRVIYSAYTTTLPAPSGSALEDQAIAGVIMWVPGSVAFLLPVLWLIVTAMTSPGSGHVVVARKL